MVKIIYRNGIPFFNINGEMIEPAAFRSFRPKPDNLSLISRTGVRLCQMLVSGLPCSNGSPYSLFGGVWKGEDEYDFSAFDRQYEMFRLFAPDAYYNVMLHLDTPEWWKEKHPELPDDSYHHITELALCEEWKQAVGKFIRAFVTYAEEKYGDRIYGYSFAAGLSNEWFDHSLYDLQFDREDSLSMKAFRELIGKPDAPVPTIESMEAGESCLRRPDSDDYRYLALCCNATADLICRFAADFQSVLHHQKLLGLFFGYVICQPQVYWNTNAYEKVWQCPDIDMLYSPASYRENRLLSGVSSYQYAVDSIALNGKLYLHENDHRTHLARFPLENGVMLQDCYSSFEEWREVFRRELCNVMQKQAAFWWFDFFGGYFSSPEYEAELALETKIYRQLAQGERHSVSEIAVFVDPMSFDCTKERSCVCTDLIRHSINELLRCGAPFEFYNLSDLKRIDLSRYKLLIIPQAYQMSEETREIISKLPQYVMLLHGAGMARGASFDIANTASLLGMSLAETDGCGQKAQYGSERFGFTKPVRPAFRVTDEEAEPLALYEDGTVCAAVKGRRVYCAVANVPWTLWRDIARLAGVHLYSEQGSGTAVCSQFIGAYTTLTEYCVLHVKEDGVYREMFSGEEYIAERGELRYRAEKGRTMLFVRKNA